MTGKSWVVVGLFSAMMAIPAIASATVYTPTPSDMNDLDHHYVYTWKITGIPTIPNGQTVISAKLTFTNMYNWDTSPNDLYIHLLDTAKYSGVSSFVDETSSTVTHLDDDFVDTRYHNDPNWLVASDHGGHEAHAALVQRARRRSDHARHDESDHGESRA